MTKPINLLSLHIHAVTNASEVNFGNSTTINIKSLYKLNEGCGKISGDFNQLPTNINNINDPDIIDTMFSHEYVSKLQDN